MGFLLWNKHLKTIKKVKTFKNYIIINYSKKYIFQVNVIFINYVPKNIFSNDKRFINNDCLELHETTQKVC